MEDDYNALIERKQILFLQIQLFELYIEIRNFIRYADFLTQKAAAATAAAGPTAGPAAGANALEKVPKTTTTTATAFAASVKSAVFAFANSLLRNFVSSAEKIQETLKKELEDISFAFESFILPLKTDEIRLENGYSFLRNAQAKLDSLKENPDFSASFFGKYFVAGYEEMKAQKFPVERKTLEAERILNALKKDYSRVDRQVVKLSEDRLEEIKQATSRLSKEAIKVARTSAKLQRLVESDRRCGVLVPPSEKEFQYMFREDITFLVTTVPSFLDELTSTTDQTAMMKTKALYGFLFEAIARFSRLLPDRNIRYDFTKEDFERVPGIGRDVVEFHGNYNGTHSKAGQRLINESVTYFENNEAFPYVSARDLFAIYVGNRDYKYINAFLRKIRGGEFSPLPQSLAEPLDGLIRYMYNSPRTTMPLVVRRCVAEMDIVAEQEGFPKEDPLKWTGLTFEESAFLSTSNFVHPAFCARGVETRPPILFLIWVPAGCCAVSTIPLGLNIGEREVLFPPKTSVFVASSNLVDVPTAVARKIFNKSKRYPNKIYVLRCFISCQKTPQSIEDLVRSDREFLDFLPKPYVAQKLGHLLTPLTPSPLPAPSPPFKDTKAKKAPPVPVPAPPIPMLLPSAPSSLPFVSPFVPVEKEAAVVAMEVDDSTPAAKMIEKNLFGDLPTMRIDTDEDAIFKIKEERENRLKNEVMSVLDMVWIPSEKFENISEFFAGIARIYTPSEENFFFITEEDLLTRDASLFLCEIVSIYMAALTSPDYFVHLDEVMKRFKYNNNDPSIQKFKKDKNSLAFFILMLSFKFVHQALNEKSFLPLLQLSRISCFDKGFQTAQQVSDWATQTVLSNLIVLNTNPQASQIKEFLSVTLSAAPYGEECDAAYETYFSEVGISEKLVPPADIFETRNLLIETAKIVLVLDGVAKRNIPDELTLFRGTTIKNSKVINPSTYPSASFPVASKVVNLYNFIVNDMKSSF